MQFGTVTENKAHKIKKTKYWSEPSCYTNNHSKTVQLTKNHEIVSRSSPFTEPFVHFHFRSAVHDGELKRTEDNNKAAQFVLLFC